MIKKYILMLVLMLVATVAFCGNNMAIYEAYLNDTAPAIVETVEEYTQDGVYVHKLKFLSRVSEGTNVIIYGILAKPVGAGPYPGLLNVHGGGGSADQMFAQVFDWAKLGYVAFCQDQPGFCNSTNSSGSYTDRSMYDVTPDATYSKLYDGVVAGLNGLRMVRSQSETDTNKVGVTGGSWGGYMTTMISGIASHRVHASFSVYGCGFYDVGSDWRRSLESLSPTDLTKWLDGLDAGRKAPQMTSNYFLTSPTDDWYFWPSAMMATFNSITNAENNFAIAANEAHRLSFPGGTGSSKHGPHRTYMEIQWMNYWLKGLGTKFGRCEPVGTPSREGDSMRVRFQYTGETAEEGTEIWYSYGETPTKSGWWRSIAITNEGNSVYSGLIPVYETEQPLMWYGVAFDYLDADNREYTCSTTYQTFWPTNLGFSANERRDEIFGEDFEGLTVRWKRPYARSFAGTHNIGSAWAYTGSKGLRLAGEYTIRCDGLRGEAMKMHSGGLKMWVKNMGGTRFDVQLMSEEPNNRRWYWQAAVTNTGSGWNEVTVPWRSFAAVGSEAPPMDMISTGLAQLRIISPVNSDIYIDDIGTVIDPTAGDLRKTPAPVNTSLVGHWRFDETNGVTAHDSLGTNHGLLYDGPAWQGTGGKIGGAVHFDGINDYIKIPDFDYQGNNNECTVSFWFTLADASGHGHEFMFCHDFYTAANCIDICFRGEETSSTGKITSWCGTTGRTIWNPSSSATYMDSEWHIYTITMSATEGLKSYIDGVSQGTSSMNAGDYNPGADIYLGCLYSGTSRGSYFGNSNIQDAKLDDLRIYNRALNMTEIIELRDGESTYKASSPTPFNGAVSLGLENTLSWSRGVGAESHDVYFGTNYSAVANADHNSPEYKGNCVAETFNLSLLDGNSTYYWAIDEVVSGTASYGDIWSFSTKNAKNGMLIIIR